MVSLCIYEIPQENGHDYICQSDACMTTSELYENRGRLSHVLNSLDQKNKQNIGLFQEKVKYFSGRVRSSSDE